MSGEVRIPLQRRRTDERALAVMRGEQPLQPSSPVAPAAAAACAAGGGGAKRRHALRRESHEDHVICLPQRH